MLLDISIMKLAINLNLGLLLLLVSCVGGHEIKAMSTEQAFQKTHEAYEKLKEVLNEEKLPENAVPDEVRNWQYMKHLLKKDFDYDNYRASVHESRGAFMYNIDQWLFIFEDDKVRAEYRSYDDFGEILYHYEVRFDWGKGEISIDGKYGWIL